MQKTLLNNIINAVHFIDKRCVTGDAQQSSEKSEAAMDDSALRRFFDRVLQHIDNATLSTSVRLRMLHNAEEQLDKFVPLLLKKNTS